MEAHRAQNVIKGEMIWEVVLGIFFCATILRPTSSGNTNAILRVIVLQFFWLPFYKLNKFQSKEAGIKTLVALDDQGGMSTILNK